MTWQLYGVVVGLLLAAAVWCVPAVAALAWAADRVSPWPSLLVVVGVVFVYAPMFAACSAWAVMVLLP